MQASVSPAANAGPDHRPPLAATPRLVTDMIADPHDQQT